MKVAVADQWEKPILTLLYLFLDFNTFALILCYYIDLLGACGSCCSAIEFLRSVLIGVLHWVACCLFISIPCAMCFVFTDFPVLCFVSVRSTHGFVMSPFWFLVGVLVFWLVSLLFYFIFMLFS